MADHRLAKRYGLTATELLDAIDRRFRAKVTLEGAVAEVHLGKHLTHLASTGVLDRFEEHDLDGRPDYTIWLRTGIRGQVIECKNVRDKQAGYRSKGKIVAYMVEVQKTRTSNNDPSSRYYDRDHFDILAVCLGKKTGLWSDFAFIRSRALRGHQKYPGKLATMHKVPLPPVFDPPWYRSLEDLLESEPS